MGCRQVYLVLTTTAGGQPEDFRKTDLYRACVKAGIIAHSEEDDQNGPLPSEEPSSLCPLSLSFRVENLWCPSCAWLVEEVLKRKRGVTKPRVSFLTDTVRLDYYPHVVTPAEITAAVGKLGYRVRQEVSDRPAGGLHREPLLRLGVSAILAMNAMMLSWTVYFGLFRDFDPSVVEYLSYPLLLVTAPVVFYGGLPIFRNAWVGMRVGRLSMDTLIALSASAAFVYSLVRMAQGSVHLYLDTAAMLITIVLLGRAIEAKVRRRVLEGIGVGELGSAKARRPLNGSVRWVRADSLVPGDTFMVEAGERVAVDGRIVEGRALVDQSVLTGEARSVVKGSHDEVLAGSLITEGRVEVCTSRTVAESSLSRMFDLVLGAIEGKNGGEGLADRMSRFLVPALLSVTTATALLLWLLGFSAEEILLRSLTMLLISCPCAIGIAVPLAKAAIVGLARGKGILIRNPEALEKVVGIDTMVFDKTGTVTEGRFAVERVIVEGAGEEEVLALVAAVEASSRHVLALEILRHVAALGLSVAEATDVEEFEGRGVVGVVAGRKVFAGNRRLVADCNAAIPSLLEKTAEEWEQQGMTAVFVGWEETVKGVLILGDRIRPDAPAFVDWLKKRGIRPIVLSGDAESTTAVVARVVGIGEFKGQMLPLEKAEAVKEMMANRARVAMVGDGVNDLAALATADAGIAFGARFDSMQEVSDVTLLGSRLDAIKDVFTIASLSLKTIRQNLIFAFAYNTLAIPAAAAGFLNPLIAVFAMFASSLTVIGNALRIVRKRG